jgi:hypothetical protein
LPVTPLAVSFTPDWQLQAKTNKPADIAAAGFTNCRDTSAGRISAQLQSAFKALDQAA